MKVATKLLTRLKHHYGDASDYRIAKNLEVTQQSISRIRKGLNGFSDATLNKIAQELGENPMLLIADYHLETQDFPGMNNVWKEMKRLAELDEIKQYQSVSGDSLTNIPTL